MNHGNMHIFASNETKWEVYTKVVAGTVGEEQARKSNRRPGSDWPSRSIPKASTSSMKMTAGAFCLAKANTFAYACMSMTDYLMTQEIKCGFNEGIWPWDKLQNISSDLAEQALAFADEFWEQAAGWEQQEARATFSCNGLGQLCFPGTCGRWEGLFFEHDSSKATRLFLTK